MLATTHVIAGAAIAVTLKNPTLIIPAALASHLVLDAIPHWNFPLVKRCSLEEFVKIAPELLGMAAAAGAFLIGFPHLWEIILLGAFFSIAPDLVVEVREIFGKSVLKTFTAFHENIQREVTPLPGLLTQAALIILLILGFALL